MSEEQIAALLAKLKDDAELQEKLKDAADLDSAVAIANDAGFDFSKAAWLRYQAQQTIELNDEELEGVLAGYYVLLSAFAFEFVCCLEVESASLGIKPESYLIPPPPLPTQGLLFI